MNTRMRVPTADRWNVNGSVCVCVRGEGGGRASPAVHSVSVTEYLHQINVPNECKGMLMMKAPFPARGLSIFQLAATVGQHSHGGGGGQSCEHLETQHQIHRQNIHESGPADRFRNTFGNNNNNKKKEQSITFSVFGRCVCGSTRSRGGWWIYGQDGRW